MEAEVFLPSGEDLSGGNQRDALRAAESIGKIPESLIVVRLFDEIRTFLNRTDHLTPLGGTLGRDGIPPPQTFFPPHPRLEKIRADHCENNYI